MSFTDYLTWILSAVSNFFGGLGDYFIQLFATIVNTFGELGLVFAFFALILFMVIQAIIAPIASEAVLSSAGGIFDQAFPTYGILVAIIAGIIGSLLGAITAFYIARWFQKRFTHYMEGKNFEEQEELSRKDRILKFLSKFIDEDSGEYVTLIEERGFLLVLIGRILPFVPFDAVSYGAGFTTIRFKDFMIATTIGTIPRVIFYVLIGTQLGKLIEENAAMFFIIAFSIFFALYGAYKITSYQLKKRNAATKTTATQ